MTMTPYLRYDPHKYAPHTSMYSALQYAAKPDRQIESANPSSILKQLLNSEAQPRIRHVIFLEFDTERNRCVK